MRNRARYSSTFQVREEYLLVPPLISNAAARNQDQCKNKSIPPTRNSRNEPGRMLVMRENYNINRRSVGVVVDRSRLTTFETLEWKRQSSPRHTPAHQKWLLRVRFPMIASAILQV